MKHYHIFFLILKIAILVQFTLVIFNKHSLNSEAYLITEIIFKIALGIFMDVIMFHRVITGLLFEDKVIISFAGGLLIYDALFNNLPELLKIYGITIKL
jgi:hypothetical protein